MTYNFVTMLAALWVMPSMCGVSGVGIKRRLREAEEAELAAGPSASSTAQSSSSTFQPRGGVRQRQAAAEAAEIGTESPVRHPQQGPLWKGLVRRWAAGKISAGELQKLAAEAMDQGASQMGDMAKLGNFGANPQNAYRALKTLLGLPSGAPGFQWAAIPTSRGDRTMHPFLMPHDFSANTSLGCQRSGAVR